MLDTVGDDAKRQGERVGARFGLGLTIGDDTRKARHVAEPAAIIFSVEFYADHDHHLVRRLLACRYNKRRAAVLQDDPLLTFGWSTHFANGLGPCRHR